MYKEIVLIHVHLFLLCNLQFIQILFFPFFQKLFYKTFLQLSW
jgi:hypothetical protein